MTFTNVQPESTGFNDARAWLCISDNGSMAVYPASVVRLLPNWPGNWRWTLATPELAKAIEGLGETGSSEPFKLPKHITEEIDAYRNALQRMEDLARTTLDGAPA